MSQVLEFFKNNFSLKEIVATIISLTIVLSGVAMLQDLASKPPGGQREATKEIFLYMWSLMGPIIGYYFGRVPAEIRADKSEAMAAKSQELTQNALRQVEQSTSAGNAAARERDVIRDAADDALFSLNTVVDSVPEAGGSEPAIDPGQMRALIEATAHLKRATRQRHIDVPAGHPR